MNTITTDIELTRHVLSLFRINLPVENISKVKTLKVVFYCYAWFLVATSNKSTLCDEIPEAWDYGPVMKNAWNNWDDIVADASPLEPLDNQVEKLIKDVFDLYKNLSSGEIVALSHSESPWVKAREKSSTRAKQNEKMVPEDIYKYYAQLAA